jgi:hypothetical protein
MEPINLIYIVSLGHSGSTILDLILGALPEIESVGELSQLEDIISGKRGSPICTCGKMFSECEYWKEILSNYCEKIKKKTGNERGCLDFGRSIENIGFLNKIKIYHEFELNSKKATKDFKQLMLKYYYLYIEIKKYSNKKYLVDSSKNPFLCYLLYKSPLFKVKIIYLFRDLRGNIESLKRKSHFQGKGKVMYYENFLKTYFFVLKGYMHNKFMLKRINSAYTIKIRYKEMCLEPKKTLNRICSFLGTQYAPEILDEKSQMFFGKKINHNIGGNRVRRGNIEKILYMKKWPDKLNFIEKVIFNLFGGGIFNKIG